MQELQEEKVIKYLAVTVTFMVCVTRVSMAVGQIANGIVLLLGLYLWYKNKNTVSISEEAKGYIKAYGVFIILVIPSILFSEKPLIGLKELLNLRFWHYIVFIVIIAFIKRRDYLDNMLTAFLYTTTIDCLVTVPQYLLKMGGLNQGWGLGGNPLNIAGIICMLLPVALVIVMETGFEKRLKKAASCAVVAMVVGLIFNRSRSAWLTELLVIPPFIYKYLKQQKKYLIIFVLVLAGIATFMATSPAFVERALSITNVTTNGSNTDRIRAWISAVHMTQDYPVTGVGLGQFREKYSKYEIKETYQNMLPTYRTVLHVHNNYLQVAAETGLVGLAGLLFFIGYFLVTSLKNYRKYRDPYDRLIFVVFLSNICMMGMFDYTLMKSTGMRVMWFLLAILLQMKATEKQQ